jgi:hypothetical protein
MGQENRNEVRKNKQNKNFRVHMRSLRSRHSLAFTDSSIIFNLIITEICGAN